MSWDWAQLANILGALAAAAALLGAAIVALRFLFHRLKRPNMVKDMTRNRSSSPDLPDDYFVSSKGKRKP